MLTKDEVLEFLKIVKKDFQPIGLSKLGIIGSLQRGNFRDDSDIDIVFDTTQDMNDRINLGKLDAGIYLDMMSEIKHRVSKKFHRNVDLIDEDGLDICKKDRFVKGAIYV